ncbi:MAG TPA: glycosyltransferase family 2 protein [Bryobacteraceae bacterium]|jgi:glycosyltransferase involved in cell wall biosynthesis|nr:glycosyltransferase family 2 protein [Bryobacteraceae bacterium]
MLITLTASALVLALIPAVLFLRNLRLYRTPEPSAERTAVSLLIPARNEERSIGECLRAALRSENVNLEVLVLDDHSTDRTSEIVEQIAREDARVKLIPGPALPAGWCGKQFACSVLAKEATTPLLCFLDADVQLETEGLSRLVEGMRASRAALMSGFPRQITISPLEQLLLPLVHFILLGFLPLNRMRQSLEPALGAGCGQLFLAQREAYDAVGGHGAIRSSRHDGLTLPRAFRRGGFATDLCDATHIARCRMYRSNRECFSGLLKNATEGMAHPKRIVPFTVLLLGGQVLPAILVLYLAVTSRSVLCLAIAAAVLVLAYLPRLVAVFRFEQPAPAALFHPVSILLLLAIQWLALARSALGVSETWKGRSYSTAARVQR